jgi:hypothetical protein
MTGMPLFALPESGTKIPALGNADEVLRLETLVSHLEVIETNRRHDGRGSVKSHAGAPQVSASADIGAPSRDVYRLIADYRFGHSRILPPDVFRNLKVQQGGYGAGTVIHFDMLAFGRTQHQRARVTEPEPGRILVEAYPDNGAVTTFTVDSLGFDRSRVTIATRLRVRSGVRGRLELWSMRRFLRRVYTAELALIDQQARSNRAGIDPRVRR